MISLELSSAVLHWTWFPGCCAQPRVVVIFLNLQPFSQKSRTPTVAKEFQIGLYDPAEADLELFCNSWSAGFLGERLYVFVFQEFLFLHDAGFLPRTGASWRCTSGSFMEKCTQMVGVFVWSGSAGNRLCHQHKQRE